MNTYNNNRIQGNNDWISDYQIYDKIPEIIPKHLITNKEQNIIDNCIRTGSDFHDPEFPHDSRTLVDPNGKFKKPGFELLQWLSAREKFRNEPFYLFNGISPQDIKQQNISNCYLLGPFATLATQPGLVKRLFDIEEVNPYGVYAVWLNVNGEWREVILDDFFPVNRKGEFVFATPTQDQNEIWVMLLEKAFAKVYGGYYKLDFGRPDETFTSLTGAPCDIYSLQSLKNNAQVMDIWNKLLNAKEKGYLIVVSSLLTGKGVESKQNTGLATDHCYSILDVREVIDSRGREDKIIQIRNPWGKGEWNGDWCDSSDLWTPQLRNQLFVRPGDGEDGLFWVNLRDFVKNFDLFYINKISPRNTFNSFRVNLPNKGQYFRVLFKVGVPVDGKYTFAITRKGFQYTNEIGEIKSIGRVQVGKLEQNGIRFIDAYKSNHRDTHVRMWLNAGEYVVITEMIYNDDTIKKFDNPNINKFPKLQQWRDFVFSTYGPGTCAVHCYNNQECMQNQVNLKDFVHFQIWKQFLKNNEKTENDFKEKIKHINPKSFSESKIKVLMQNGQEVMLSTERIVAQGICFFTFHNHFNQPISFIMRAKVLKNLMIITKKFKLAKVGDYGQVMIPPQEFILVMVVFSKEECQEVLEMIRGQFYPSTPQENNQNLIQNFQYLVGTNLNYERASAEVNNPMKYSSVKAPETPPIESYQPNFEESGYDSFRNRNFNDDNYSKNHSQKKDYNPIEYNYNNGVYESTQYNKNNKYDMVITGDLNNLRANSNPDDPVAVFTQAIRNKSPFMNKSPYPTISTNQSSPLANNNSYMINEPVRNVYTLENQVDSPFKKKHANPNPNNPYIEVSNNNNNYPAPNYNNNNINSSPFNPNGRDKLKSYYNNSNPNYSNNMPVYANYSAQNPREREKSPSYHVSSTNTTKSFNPYLKSNNSGMQNISVTPFQNSGNGNNIVNSEFVPLSRPQGRRDDDEFVTSTSQILNNKGSRIGNNGGDQKPFWER